MAILPSGRRTLAFLRSKGAYLHVQDVRQASAPSEKRQPEPLMGRMKPASGWGHGPGRAPSKRSACPEACPALIDAMMRPGIGQLKPAAALYGLTLGLILAWARKGNPGNPPIGVSRNE